MARINKNDPQQKAVYDAEDKLINSQKEMSQDAARGFFNLITTGKWFKKQTNDRKIKLIFGRPSLTYSYCRGNEIVLAEGQYNMAVICHELAHIIVPKAKQHHNANFCRTYLKMVKKFIGKKEYHQLKKQFIKNNIDFQK